MHRNMTSMKRTIKFNNNNYKHNRLYWVPRAPITVYHRSGDLAQGPAPSIGAEVELMEAFFKLLVIAGVLRPENVPPPSWSILNGQVPHASAQPVHCHASLEIQSSPLHLNASPIGLGLLQGPMSSDLWSNDILNSYRTPVIFFKFNSRDLPWHAWGFVVLP